MKSRLPQLGYDSHPFRQDESTMDQQTIEKALRFFIAKLPEDQLREFDELMAGSSLDTPEPKRASTPAMDAAFGDADRQNFLRLGPSARKAIRFGRSAHVRRAAGIAQDSAPVKEGSVFDEAHYPHANRLRGY